MKLYTHKSRIMNSGNRSIWFKYWLQVHNWKKTALYGEKGSAVQYLGETIEVKEDPETGIFCIEMPEEEASLFLLKYAKET